MNPFETIFDLFVFFFPVALTIGAAIDAGAHQKGKQRLQQTAFWKWLITARAAEGTQPPRIRDSIQTFHDTVLIRVFDENITSRRFLFRSAVYSLVLMALIFITVYLLNSNPESKYTIFDAHLYPVISFLSILTAVFVTMVIDYFSFTQTMIFFSLAKNAKSNWSLGWLAVGDLIISANVFAFIFPICLIILTYFMLQLPERIQINHVWSKHELPSKILTKEVFEEIYQADLYVQNNKDHLLAQRSKKLLVVQLVALRDNNPKAHMSRIANTIISPDLEARLEMSNPQMELALTQLVRESIGPDHLSTPNTENADRVYDLKVNFTPSLQELASLYGFAFVLSNNVRIGFLGMVTLDPTLININELLTAVYINRLESEKVQNSGALICFSKGKFQSIIISPQESPLKKNNCNEWIYVLGNFKGAIREMYSSLGYPHATVSLTIFFLSSFGVTMLIYVAVSTFALFRLTSWSLDRLKWRLTLPFREGYVDPNSMAFMIAAGCLVVSITGILMISTTALWIIGYF